jgi:hypothetical protein
MSQVSCPNCGSHDLSHARIGVFVHRECSASETGTTQWQQNVESMEANCDCPKCGEPCRPSKLVCPRCNLPVEEPGEN